MPRTRIALSHRRLIGVLTCAVLVTACGGGGGGGELQEPIGPPPEGFWIGDTSNGRSIALIVLSTGEYWGLYSSVGNDEVVAGAFQGTGEARGSSFFSNDGIDFNLEGLGANGFDVTANFVAQQQFNGHVEYNGIDDELDFDTTYDETYDATPTIASIVGRYDGSAATADGTEGAFVVITEIGALGGASAGGCTYNGTVTPRSDGNVYDIEVFFNGSPCSNESSRVTGVAVLEPETGLLRSAALNSDRDNGFIFTGIESVSP